MLGFKNDDGTPVRDFSSTEEMDERIIEGWNSVVKTGDKVYHLGDVFFGSKETFKSNWNRLKGSKRLLLGNHDDAKFLAAGGFFKKIGLWRIFKEHGVTLSHVPLHEGSFRHSVVNVHGHTHTRKSPEGPYRCVCVEQTNYVPLNLEELRVI
tara:strand:- start:92 stop:547 length:456 start_codon:yes stop_codon:yes gene_type:complete